MVRSCIGAAQQHSLTKHAKLLFGDHPVVEQPLQGGELFGELTRLCSSRLLAGGTAGRRLVSDRVGLGALLECRRYCDEQWQ
jgi:hypothetical protein